MEGRDRQRITWLGIATAIVLVALWVFSATRSSQQTTGDDGYQPKVPVFLSGEPVPPPPAVIDIAVPPAPNPNERPARASFRRIGRTTCWTVLAPSGTEITVINVANRFSVTCKALPGALPDGVDVVLDTEAFTEIANLANSPIHVRVSW